MGPFCTRQSCAMQQHLLSLQAVLRISKLQCRSQTEHKGRPTGHTSRHSTKYISASLSRPLWTGPLHMHHPAHLSSAPLRPC